MRDAAKVRSVDAITRFKAALVEFVDLARSSLTESEGEVVRVLNWLRHDRTLHWQREVKKRREKVAQAQSDLARAQIALDPEGKPRDCTDEKRALRKAQIRLDDAERHVADVKRWIRTIEHEQMLFKAQIQGLRSVLEGNMDRAGAKLGRMVEAIDKYVAVSAPNTSEQLARSTGGGLGPGASPGVSRGVSDAPAERLPDPPALRDLAPAIEERGDIAFDPPDVDPAPAPPGRVPGQVCAALDRTPDLAGLSSRVTLDPGALDAERVILIRTPPAGPTDSGWHIAAWPPAEETSPVAVRLSWVFRARPDWRDLLALPPGLTAVVRGGELEAVFDESDQNVWAMRR